MQEIDDKSVKNWAKSTEKDWNNNTIMSSSIAKLNKKLINMDKNRRKIYQNEQKPAKIRENRQTNQAMKKNIK